MNNIIYRNSLSQSKFFNTGKHNETLPELSNKNGGETLRHPKDYPSVLSALYSGKPPCLNFHQATLSAVNDATASPPFSALLMKIYSAEFRQI